MKPLVSEGLPNDGSYQMKRLLDEANARLKESGKRGKTCTLRDTGYQTIGFKFNIPGKGQVDKGSGERLTKEGIKEAERKARLISNQLEAGQYTDDWLMGLMGRKLLQPVEKVEKIELKKCSELISEYKSYWFRENKGLKKPEVAWYMSFRHIEKCFSDNDSLISSEIIKGLIERSEPNTVCRSYLLQGLFNLFQYHEIFEFDKLIQQYKDRNKPERKITYKPTDDEIKYIYHNGFQPNKRCDQRYLFRHTQWQFLYGLLATYGLRIHEAWSIANWDKPVTLKNGDWVTVDNDDSNDSSNGKAYQGNEFVVPAILDPTNKDFILCIKHDTKTGYRMAIPISPNGEDWVKEFNLIQPLNLPEMFDPLTPRIINTGSARCTHNTCRWFKNHNYGFTPHALRHAYNHRAHSLGINPSLIAQSMGHTIQMNQSTYLKNMPESRKLQNIKNAFQDRSNKESELEVLKRENEVLRKEVESLRMELKLVQTEARLIKLLEDK